MSLRVVAVGLDLDRIERDARNELARAGDYAPGDRPGSGPPWSPNDARVRAWEHAHGHDVRFQCWPGRCQLVHVPYNRTILALVRMIRGTS